MEDFYKELEAFLDQEGIEDLESPEGQEIINAFIEKWNATNTRNGPLSLDNAKSAADYIELAEDAESSREAIKLLRHALKLEPDNIDAQLKYTVLRTQNIEDKITALQKIIKKAEEEVKDDLEQSDHQDFYGYYGHRPYMRARHQYMRFLAAFGRKREAIKEGEALLDIDFNDRLGVRHDLMALYAYFEDAQKAEALCAKYKEEDSAAMLLPLSLVYYRTGRYQEAQEVLKKIYQRNPDLKRFCAEVMDGSIDERGMGKYYRPDSIEELVMLYYNYDYAYNDTCFFMWAERVVKTFPRPRTRKKTKK